jgi:hypothetical protein
MDSSRPSRERSQDVDGTAVDVEPDQLDHPR